MRSAVAALFVAIGCLTAGPAIAAQRQVQCTLVVKGKTYINGPCSFEAFGTDGSFAIGVLRDGQPASAEGYCFV